MYTNVVCIPTHVTLWIVNYISANSILRRDRSLWRSLVPLHRKRYRKWIHRFRMLFGLLHGQCKQSWSIMYIIHLMTGISKSHKFETLTRPWPDIYYGTSLISAAVACRTVRQKTLIVGFIILTILPFLVVTWSQWITADSPMFCISAFSRRR